MLKAISKLFGKAQRKTDKITPNKVEPQRKTYRSRWGFHPVPYDDFLILKELRRLHFLSVFQRGAWKRWSRKLPHNRLTYDKIRNDKGQVTGRSLTGVQAEPEFNRENILEVRQWWDSENRKVMRTHLDIVAAFELARRPMATPDLVKHISDEHLREYRAIYKKISGEK